LEQQKINKMNITLTPEHLLIGALLLLMGLQIRQHIQVEKAKKEIDKLWDQISTFNTMVAIKLLETQKNIDKLNENKKD
jgi:hypothetical protein